MKSSSPCYWVYILHCENGSYYTGYTSDLNRRFNEHLNGTGKCKYTRSFKALSIAQHWEIKGGKGPAMQVERYIKTLSKTQKEQIILNPAYLEDKFFFKINFSV